MLLRDSGPHWETAAGHMLKISWAAVYLGKRMNMCVYIYICKKHVHMYLCLRIHVTLTCISIEFTCNLVTYVIYMYIYVYLYIYIYGCRAHLHPVIRNPYMYQRRRVPCRRGPRFGCEPAYTLDGSQSLPMCQAAAAHMFASFLGSKSVSFSTRHIGW